MALKDARPRAFDVSDAFTSPLRRSKKPASKRGASQVSWNTQNRVTEELISERRLWTAVLVNAAAVEDWRGGTPRVQREAQEFVFESDADFEMVCAGAG